MTDGRGRELEADLGICGTLVYDSGSWQVCGAGGLVKKWYSLHNKPEQAVWENAMDQGWQLAEPSALDLQFLKRSPGSRQS